MKGGLLLFFKMRVVFMPINTNKQFGAHLLLISMWHYLH